MSPSPKISSGVKLENATLAGGCFWCVEADYAKLRGVKKAVSGYSGGKEKNPTYEQVAHGATGHREAVRIAFDPREVSYAEVLDYFWQHINPTDAGGQFADRGKQYRSAIFYENEEQKKIAEKSKAALANSGRFDLPITTEILPFEEFWPAEEYHQNYATKNPTHYNLYRVGSGREKFIEENLRKKLTPEQFAVTQQCSTEPPFQNEFWDNKKPGIYVDVVSGEPLFSSLDKFDSGTGWPSFTKPLYERNIVAQEDTSLGTQRTEVKSKIAGSHLGHLFDDGPREQGGQRFCINSAALKFIPKADLEKEGYCEYVKLFEN